jgi:phosphohistidine phosphatase SixA
MRRWRTGAHGLGQLVPRVDAVWCSRLVRAWQTAEILHAQARWPAPQPCPALEENLTPSQVLRDIAAHAALQRLAVVGHAPGLDELAAYAALGTDEVEFFVLRKGGAACLRFDGLPRRGGATLLWLATPKLLRKLGH